MKAALILAAALCTCSAHAQQTELQRCRALADKDARLACYDGIPLGAAPAAPPSPAAAASAAAASFGLERRQSKTESQAVESQIMGAFQGWGPKSLLKLSNGQVWQVTDDSSAVLNLKNPKVVVRRASMGTFMIEFEGSNETARVRRLE